VVDIGTGIRERIRVGTEVGTGTEIEVEAGAGLETEVTMGDPDIAVGMIDHDNPDVHSLGTFNPACASQYALPLRGRNDFL